MDLKESYCELIREEKCIGEIALRLFYDADTQQCHYDWFMSRGYADIREVTKIGDAIRQFLKVF